MAIFGAAIGVAASIYNAYAQKRAAQKREKALKEADATLYERTTKPLKYKAIQKASEKMYPGLLPSSGKLSPWGYVNGTSTYKGNALPDAGASPLAAAHAGTGPQQQTGMPSASNPVPPQITTGSDAQPALAQDQADQNTLVSMHGGVGPLRDLNERAAEGDESAKAILADLKSKGYDTTSGALKKMKKKDKGKFKRALKRSNESTSSGGTYPGNLATQRMMEFLQTPGKLGSQTYERAQEQINQGALGDQNAIQGSVAGAGISQDSGIAAGLKLGASEAAAHNRNDAAREYSIAQEGLKRADTAAGVGMYQDFLNTTFGLQQSRSSAANQGSTLLGAAAGAAGSSTSALGSGVQAFGNAVSGGMAGMGGGGAAAAGGGGATAASAPNPTLPSANLPNQSSTPGF